MPETTELHARLLAHARAYDPTAHTRSLLLPFRDVVLLWRAKYMSYEQIVATLAQNGIRVSPAGVGVFCRAQFSKAELERARRETREGTPKPLPSTAGGTRREPTGGKVGPKIARDDY